MQSLSFFLVQAAAWAWAGCGFGLAWAQSSGLRFIKPELWKARPTPRLPGQAGPSPPNWHSADSWRCLGTRWIPRERSTAWTTPRVHCRSCGFCPLQAACWHTASPSGLGSHGRGAASWGWSLVMISSVWASSLCGVDAISCSLGSVVNVCGRSSSSNLDVIACSIKTYKFNVSMKRKRKTPSDRLHYINS